MSSDKLAQALELAAKCLREINETVTDVSDTLDAVNKALAAHEAEKQAEPLKGYCRLLKYEGGVWVPATEFLPGPTADDWIKLAETDEHWRIDRRPSGPQLRRAFETAFSKPPVQNTAPPPPLSEQDKALDEALADAEKADEYIDALLDEVLGPDRPEWSSAYGHADAMQDVRDRMNELMRPMVDKAWARFESALAEQDKEDAELTDEEIKSVHDHHACLPDLVGLKDQWPQVLRFAREVLRAARAKKEPQ